ncbi:MAG: DegT/DnrJ/EryC1/StrS family aminotransferase [Candidatus Omnitrophota bacterium]
MIPVNEPYLGKEELKNIKDCVRSGWISSKGAYIEKFEKAFSDFCGMRYGVATTNGTTAIHLALAALGVGKGDEVIVPTFTMIATAYAVAYTGAKPVFVDCEEETWNMDVSKVAKLVNSRTKALLPVHIYGHPVDMDPLLDIAKKRKLYVVEDAAEAHGAEYKGKRCGSFGHVNCFSFYANKIITTGEGGMVVTNDKKLSERLNLLKDLAHSPKKRFLHTDLAFNYRMTNMQAAIGFAQMQRAGRLVEKKRRIARLYKKYLKDIEGIRLPAEMPWAKNVYWMYSVLVEDDFGISRDELMKRLAKEGVGTRAFFVPMHVQPIFKRSGAVDKKKKYPVADYISKRGLYLPTGMTLTEKQIVEVCDKVRKVQKKTRKSRR